LLFCVIAFAAPVKAEPPAPREKEAALPAPPAVADDAPPLRKAQYELVQEGLAYIKRCQDVIRADVWVASDFRKYADVLTETCRVAAELEEKPEKRLAWFEARVRRMKEVEYLLDRGVRSGTFAAHELNLVRFQRLQAEVDLLKLKAEVEKGKK
jgi:hypothetical protein